MNSFNLPPLHGYLKYLAVPPGYKKFLHYFGNRRKGCNLLLEDWDLCIILDACRADIFTSIIGSEWSPPYDWVYDTIVSVESATEPWTDKTFNNDFTEGIEPVLYVTSNPYSTKAHGSPAINQFDEVWRYGWDSELGTVPPKVVTDRAVHHLRNQPGRVMVHYLQPHSPHLQRDGDSLRSRYSNKNAQKQLDEDKLEANWHSPNEDSNIFNEYLPGKWELPTDELSNMWQRLKWGNLEHGTVWDSYRETLLIVLDEVKTLLQSIDAETAVITSDHGEAFGEWGLYKHPYHMPFSVLREVPYLTTSAKTVINYELTDYDLQDLGNREEQLRALGYR